MYKYRLTFNGVVIDEFDNPYEWHTIAAAVTFKYSRAVFFHESKRKTLQAIAADCGVNLEAVK